MRAPVQQIGRFRLSVSDITIIQERRPRLFWWRRPTYRIFLANGSVLQMTAAEKEQLDETMTLHQTTLGVCQMIQRMQFFNRPPASV